jgi:hypothetical protein
MRLLTAVLVALVLWSGDAVGEENPDLTGFAISMQASCDTPELAAQAGERVGNRDGEAASALVSHPDTACGWYSPPRVGYVIAHHEFIKTPLGLMAIVLVLTPQRGAVWTWVLVPGTAPSET